MNIKGNIGKLKRYLQTNGYVIVKDGLKEIDEKYVEALKKMVEENEDIVFQHKRKYEENKKRNCSFAYEIIKLNLNNIIMQYI